MGFVKNNEVKKCGREPVIANAHRLLSGDVEPLVGVDGSGANTDARLVRQERFEAIIQRLFNEGIPIGKEQYLLRVGTLLKNIDESHRGPCFSGTCRHDKKGSAPATLKSLRHSADSFVLIRAFHDCFIDGCILERLLVLTDTT